MFAAAESCIAARQHLPALVLIYVLIDSLAWAASDKAKSSVRTQFEDWVTKWLLPDLVTKSPTLTATDLYSARCAVLHTLASESDLSRAGTAKRIVYAWGNAEVGLLDALITEAEFVGTMVAIHCGTLLAATGAAIAGYVKAAENDPSLAQRLIAAASKHYMSVPNRES